MLLPKTLQFLQNTKTESLRDNLTDMLNADGIAVSSVDLIFGRYFIYVLLSSGTLAPVFLYEESISHKQAQNYGLPKLHCCNCSILEQDFNLRNKAHTLKYRHYIAKLTTKNSFNFKIKQGISEVGLYNDYPLEICPACSNILEQIANQQFADDALNHFVFSQQYLYLLESHTQICHKELLSLQKESIKCYKCKNDINLDSEIWVQIHNNQLKMYCC